VVTGCREAVRQLWEYLDHGLGTDDQRRLEDHLAFCVRCCGELAFARELRELLRTRTDSPPPHDARERLERFIDELGEERTGA
jgi:anti-sigma factor (TIGR02949 family)